MNKTLNVRFFLRLLVIVAVVAGAVHLVHRRQAGRQSQAFLHQADAAESQRDFQRAIVYLRRFLALRSEDLDMRVRLGLLLAQTARTAQEMQQAYYVLEDVLHDDPQRQDVRRRDVTLAMDLGLFNEALDHLNKHLIPADPSDGTLYEQKGKCLAATGKLEGDKRVKGDQGAVEALAEAVKLKPDLFLAYRFRAILLRQRLNRPDDADKAIEAMLANNDVSAPAHLAAAYYYQQIHADIDFVELQVNEAQRLAPDDPEVILMVAELAQTQADAFARSARKQSEVVARDKDLADGRKVIEGACAPVRLAIEKHLPDSLQSPPAERAERDKWIRERALVARMFEVLASFEVRLGRLPDAEKIAQRGVDTLPDFPNLRVSLVDVQILQAKWVDAEKQLQQLLAVEYPPAVVHYQRGRILASQDKYRDAAKELEDAATTAGSSAELAHKIFFLLGKCYDRIGLADRRHEAFVKALPADPREDLWYQVSMRTAAGLAESGRVAEAIQVYERVAVQYKNAFTPLARLKLLETLRQPDAAKRIFSPIEELLKAAPEDVERELVRADLYAVQKKIDEARDVLTRARQKFPEAIEPWAALALLESRDQKPDVAADVLAEAERKFGDQVLLRLTRARLIPPGSPAAAGKEFERLAANVDKFTPDERRRLLRGLADMAQGSAPPNVTARLWDRLVEQADDNLGIQLVRFDRALEADDGTRLRQALDSISQLDRAGGIAGTSARTAAATYSIWEARKTGNLDQLPKVLDDLRGLARDRAGWSKIPLAEALIFELQKKPDSAIEKYRRAVELGERDPEALRRLIELLYEQKQFAAANAVYRLLPEGTAASPEFQLLAAKVSLQNRDFGRALALAAKAVPDDSKDYKKLIWRGRILWMTGNMIKAKQPLLRAKDLAPDQPAPWIALVAYYASRGPDFKPEIDKLLDEAKAKINKADAPLALAQCYESIGRPDLAKPYIEQDLKNRPNDVHVLSAAATLRLRENDFDGAEKLLLQILTADSVKKTPEDVRAAKQRLAFIMSYNRGDYEESRQKLERMGLLDQRQISRKLTGSETADEIRDRAVTLAIQPDLSSKREAIRLLVEFAAWQDLRAEDQFLLAHLHNVTGDWPQARVVLASLIQAQGEEANPLYVAYMALNLIRNSDAEAADKLVARLEKDKLQGEALRTIELRARLLAATGHADAARKLLLEQLNKPNPRLAAIASLLEQTDSGAAAEPLYKQIVAGSKRPEAVLALAAYYGRQYRAAEALALCDQAWKSAKPEAVAEASVAVLYAARVPKPDDMAHVAGRLEEALRQNPGSPTLLGTMAAVLNLRGDYTRAIAVYRQVCDRDPKDALARNNLAFLLAAHGGEYDKALAELERAKKMVGAIPMLLDTEAQIYLAKKDPAKAVERLKEAIALEPSGANYFHLAQAYHASNKELDARVAWGQAQKRKLKPADLHSLERPAYQKLAAEFAAP